MVQNICVLLIFLCFTGCNKLYYATWEALGKQKRDLLREQVEDLTQDQEDVNQEFSDALSKLRSLYGSPPSGLAQAYDQLQKDYDQAKSKSEALSYRIDKVVTVAHDLFTEWEDEISKLKTPKYREDSRRKLKITRQKFAKLETSMRKAEKDIPPVLASLEEQVIYLKHNLNAQALGNVQGEVKAIEGDLKTLSLSIHKSISESQNFITNLSDDSPR